ncbi:MAG: prolyl oligopeptidase family serine peptidase [bacterium]|nr:prolyl oligopeptidase family serine peptidase [bacterium]
MNFSQKEIVLSPQHSKMIESGWGSEVVTENAVSKITYDSDGNEVEGYLAHPIDTKKKYPLIIWNRGGNLKEGAIDEFLAKGMFGEIASWGYVVLASQYRDKDEFGGSEINDILNLFPLASSIDFCDDKIIGMEGWSRGGMMTYKVLTLTDKIKCAVIISGLADIIRSEEERSGLSKVYRKLFGSDDGVEFTKRKKERSAVYFADKINKETKILLIHGTKDDKVSYKDSEDMFEKLKAEGVECELKLIEGGDHYLKRQRKEVVGLRREWFKKYLKN